jgi:hypothetical protein
MKYSYTFIKIIAFIIGIYIFYPIVDKYLNRLLGINKNTLKEGFVWSRDTINKFNVYQDTVNLNANQFNIPVLQEQSSEDEVNEMMKTGYWPWSEDTKKQYIEGVWQNSMLKFDPDAALDYAMRLYNETAVKRLLSWNTKEGQFLLYGSSINNNNIIGIDSDGNGISDDGKIGKKSIIKCSDDLSNPVLQKTTINGYNLFNGFKNTTTSDIAFKDIPNEVPGFSFVRGECNPCSALNAPADYSCPFNLNVEGNHEISDVWKELWQVN